MCLQLENLVQIPQVLRVATTVPSVDDIFTMWWLRSRKLTPKAHRKAFDSMVALISWMIWLQRNDHVFHNGSVAAVLLVEHSLALVD
jgi:hypothetical protein